MQREMPWIQEVKSPELVEESLVRKCKTHSQALALSIQLSDYSQEVIAERLGISAAQLSRLRNGRRGVSDKIMQRIAHATGNYAVSQFTAYNDGFILVRPAKSERIRELEEQIEKLRGAA